jgi:integrase
VPLASARTLALEGQGHATEGIAPRERSRQTVRQLAESYFAKHVRPKLRSAKTIERRFVKNALPVIGERPIEELHKQDLNRVLDAITDRGAPIEAARCFEDLRAMLRWAVSRGDLDHSPMEGMRKPATSAPRERILFDAEIEKLWHVLPTALPRSVECQQIIKLCLLTAARVGEVSGMTRAEIDLKARVWTIPAARSRNKHPHTVPLSEAALAVIEEARGAIFLFSGIGHTSLPGHAVAHTIRLAQARFGLPQWSAHDLRRTAVTGMAALGVAPIVLDHVVGHRSVTKAGVTLAVYSQYDYAKEKREALDLWADRLIGIVGSGAAQVIPRAPRLRPCAFVASVERSSTPKRAPIS